jgi:hypothetical protein
LRIQNAGRALRAPFPPCRLQLIRPVNRLILAGRVLGPGQA